MIEKKAIWGNRVLDSIPPADLEALVPHLRRVHLSRGEILVEQADEVRVIHFPVGADLGNALVLRDGSALEVSSVGRDGLSGLAAFLADEPIGWRVEVRAEGDAIKLGADRLRARCEASPRLRALLLAVTHDNQVETSQIAACNARHDATARLARWLLTLSDRTDRTEVLVTQQDMGETLGTRRTTITQSAKLLKTRGAIRFSRGRLTIVDRVGLEAEACECYATLKTRREAWADHRW